MALASWGLSLIFFSYFWGVFVLIFVECQALGKDFATYPKIALNKDRFADESFVVWSTRQRLCQI